MIDFLEWIKAPDFSNQSHQDLRTRMRQGRDQGEPFIINQLKQYGIEITPTNNVREDKTLKIDGYWNNQPVQIKLRSTSRDGRNDIAYEVCRNHVREQPLGAQVKNPQQTGRDLVGQVQHYFVMDNTQTNIVHVAAARLKTLVIQAILELNKQRGGVLTNAFQSSTGVQLRPTQDNDPQSFTPLKVMAFIPVDVVADQKYPVKKVA